MSIPIAALRPGQILISKTGSRVVFVRSEARAIAVGEAGRRVLMVPVNGGEPLAVVRTLFPVRDNQGRWQPGQELNGRYSQADLDAGVLTPTDEFATDEVPEQDPRPTRPTTTKRAKRKEAAVDDQKQDPPSGEQTAPEGGVDAPVVLKERKPRKAREPKAPKPDAGPVSVLAARLPVAEAEAFRTAAFNLQPTLTRGQIEKAMRLVLTPAVLAYALSLQPAAATAQPDPED